MNCRMKVMDEFLGETTLEDVKWLCSLSESELDFLISLKMLVIQRSKMIGHTELANKFNLKTLRAMGLVLIEYLKLQVKDLSPTLDDLAKSPSFLDACDLLKCGPKNAMSIEEVEGNIGADLPRTMKRPVASKRRRKKRRVY
ncbi:Spc97/Spc98 family of spindle pole body (SBP) component [Quillaja saponaria]|uniref:Spc97/Spc98 family of spindle pole body (SBP) component n=1 Tax=Quillaja saponaria TaxID=32244 RepID=A0AAD7QG47_QUISA|nr:Spc97/Spc98 family of spindle pole body (SBP) component [Quillaja saponaria]